MGLATKRTWILKKQTNCTAQTTFAFQLYKFFYNTFYDYLNIKNRKTKWILVGFISYSFSSCVHLVSLVNGFSVEVILWSLFSHLFVMCVVSEDVCDICRSSISWPMSTVSITVVFLPARSQGADPGWWSSTSLTPKSTNGDLHWLVLAWAHEVLGKCFDSFCVWAGHKTINCCKQLTFNSTQTHDWIQFQKKRSFVHDLL